MFGNLSLKLAALGAMITAGAVFILRYISLKKQRDNLKRVTETLRSRNSRLKQERKIVKEEDIKKTATITAIRTAVDVDKREDLEDIPSLTNPNDF
jgi:hypothetical protein